MDLFELLLFVVGGIFVVGAVVAFAIPILIGSGVYLFMTWLGAADWVAVRTGAVLGFGALSAMAGASS